ncbi:hypothetical protein HHL19_16980 [Streptomyces sp. R302]|uniref:hypothetical protein n=1 Tax=unclassified Streptomyces TaxID=2593676 RepID=UPI00145E309C|nr:MULTISPECIES: hypothetical protein [unclassified Streptomyces]NML52740.1 hypothetical protein [Streptomyces sp. R301]NML80331.1 hypothetical protein [Streptomyces sp. R302]
MEATPAVPGRRPAEQSGLAMDRKIFLLSRLREDRPRTGDAETAVAHAPETASLDAEGEEAVTRDEAAAAPPGP